MLRDDGVDSNVIDFTLVGREVLLNKKKVSLVERLINKLEHVLNQKNSGKSFEQLQAEAEELRRQDKLRLLERKLANQAYKNENADWERAGADEALWSRIVSFGLDDSKESLPTLTYRRFKLALMDAYRLGLLGVENEVNKKTAECLNLYWHHKAVNVELRKEISNLKKTIKKLEKANKKLEN